MWPRDGYWRPNLKSDVFVACPVEIACIEGSLEKQLGECRKGYKGNLCNTCEENFGKSLDD